MALNLTDLGAICVDPALVSTTTAPLTHHLGREDLTIPEMLEDE